MKLFGRGQELVWDVCLKQIQDMYTCIGLYAFIPCFRVKMTGYLSPGYVGVSTPLSWRWSSLPFPWPGKQWRNSSLLQFSDAWHGLDVIIIQEMLRAHICSICHLRCKQKYEATYLTCSQGGKCVSRPTTHSAWLQFPSEISVRQIYLQVTCKL